MTNLDEGRASAAKATLINGKTPWEFACEWYGEDEIYRSIQARHKSGFAKAADIPADIESREFSDWLTDQYRLAMRKRIEIGQRSLAQQSAARIEELEKMIDGLLSAIGPNLEGDPKTRWAVDAARSAIAPQGQGGGNG